MKDKREIVHPSVFLQLDIIDDKVRREHGVEPMTVDEKLTYLRQMLRVYSKALNWNNQKRYSQATLDVIRAEIEYWESIDEPTGVGISTKKDHRERIEKREKIKKAVQDYWDDNYGEGDCDASKARDIINALDDEFDIRGFWKDPERSIKDIINGY